MRADAAARPSGSPGTSALERYYSDAEAASARAEQAGVCHDRDFRVAGLTLRLRFCGPALIAPLTRALAHAAIPQPGTRPDCTIVVWDERHTGVAMPAPRWSLGDYAARGEVRRFRDGTRYTAFSIAGTILTLYDRDTNRGLYWIRDADAVPWHEQGAPFRNHLSWWLATRERLATHAAAVGDESGCVLLAGRGGSGKSNTALSCLVAGLSYLGDDYCVVGHEDSAPMIWNLYGTGKVHGGDLVRLPSLAPLVSNPQREAEDKAIFFFHEHAHLASRLRPHARLKAVLLPRVDLTAQTALRPAPPAAALLALAPSTTSQTPYGGEEIVRVLTRAVRAVPAFHLTLGADAGAAPDVIASLLARLR